MKLFFVNKKVHVSNDQKKIESKTHCLLKKIKNLKQILFQSFIHLISFLITINLP